MFRRFLYLSIGSLALLVVLGLPSQLHAQRFRASLPPAIQPGFRGVVTPRFPIRVNPGFNRGAFVPGFNRGAFVPGFNRGFFDPRFNRGFFDPRFNMGFSPGFNMGFSPGFNMGFSPLFFRPF